MIFPGNTDKPECIPATGVILPCLERGLAIAPALLGRPRSVVPFRRKNEEVWDWKCLHVHEERLFNVHFDLDSDQVVRVSISEISGA